MIGLTCYTIQAHQGVLTFACGTAGALASLIYIKIIACGTGLYQKSLNGLCEHLSAKQSPEFRA